MFLMTKTLAVPSQALVVSEINEPLPPFRFISSGISSKAISKG